MGTIAPNPYYTPEVAERCMREIFLPTVEAMCKEGRPFKGCLYFGLMITKDGPKVIEYNCRFGDPETQVVLPLLESDLLTIMEAVADERLAEADVRFSAGSACCVVLASDGYPQKYQTGFPITVDDGMQAELFVAGAKRVDGQLLTAGGRVLGVTATAPTLREAVDKAYANVQKVHFDNAFCRKDIGQRALNA
jgi:phosphoribosylamine--glycine ligase